jgi:hypothetical protein
MPLVNKNVNTIPAWKRRKKVGSIPPPPSGDFIALEINVPSLLDVVALESGLSDKVELET